MLSSSSLYDKGGKKTEEHKNMHIRSSKMVLFIEKEALAACGERVEDSVTHFPPTDHQLKIESLRYFFSTGGKIQRLYLLAFLQTFECKF